SNTTTLRNIVGLTNLTENEESTPVDMKDDPLYRRLQANPAFRQVDQTNNTLTSPPLSLRRNVDYELLRGAKKLVSERDYTFNPQLGYISLTVPLRNDEDRKSTRLNSSHVKISYAVFCLKKKNKYEHINLTSMTMPKKW